MSKRKKSGARDDRPVRSSVSDKYLTWADGSFVTHEHYDDYPQEAPEQVDAMTEEEVYASSLRAGLPRDPLIEARLDIAKVERLLNRLA
jgi:hypothetical protein